MALANLPFSLALSALSLGALVFTAQAAEPIRVACIGNSITEGGYPEKLAPLLGPGYRVENHGVSGCTSLKKGDMPYWTLGKLDQVFALKPNIVTIKLGTNDSKPQNWDAHGVDFSQDLHALIDTLNGISTKPRIWLVLPVAVFPNAFGIREDTLRLRILPILKAVAKARGLGVIDAHTPTSTHPEIYTDGVHMRPAGNDSIAAIFHRALTEPSSVRRGAGRTGPMGEAGMGDSRFARTRRYQWLAGWWGPDGRGI